MKVGVASADPTDAVLSHDDHGVKVVHEVSAGFGYFFQGPRKHRCVAGGGG